MITFVTSCTEKKKEDGAEKVICFDSQKSIKLYDMKDMMDSTFSIIPLETDDEALIGEIDKIEIRNNRIYIMDHLSQSVYIFDMGGKYLNKKTAIGQGPGEYANLSYMTVTDSSLIIIDHYMEKQIEYRLPSLELIGEERIFEKIWAHDLFYLNGHVYYTNEANGAGTSMFNLFSRKNSTEDFKKYLPFSGKETLVLHINGPRYAINGNEASLIYSGNDRIYRLRDGQIYPEYEMKYKDEKIVYSSEIMKNVLDNNPSGRIIGINQINESDKYLFLNVSVLKDLPYLCIYNKQDNTVIICQGMINSRFSSDMSILSRRIIDNKLIHWRETHIQKNSMPPHGYSFSSKEFEYKYKTMWENLKEDDNPVLFIYNLK
jgi:hypothetical protein